MGTVLNILLVEGGADNEDRQRSADAGFIQRVAHQTVGLAQSNEGSNGENNVASAQA